MGGIAPITSEDDVRPAAGAWGDCPIFAVRLDFLPWPKARVPVCHAAARREIGWVPASPRCGALAAT